MRCNYPQGLPHTSHRVLGEAVILCHSEQHTKECACHRPLMLQTRGSTVARTQTYEL